MTSNNEIKSLSVTPIRMTSANRIPVVKKTDLTNRTRMLSFQQRKQLLIEQQERIAQIRTKISTRKLAYIWLRKHFYPRRFLNREILLPLPSQIQ